MRRTGKAIAVIATGLLAATTATASTDVAGVWRNVKHEAVVELRDCPNGLCGDFLRQPWDGADLQVVRSFRRLSDTRWGGGRIHDLNDGATYNVDLELIDPQRLRVRGCWLSFCEVAIWRRVR